MLQDVFHVWDMAGEFTSLQSWGWLFVDDLLVSFDTWQQARRLVPQLEQAFLQAGLCFSRVKSELLGLPRTLETGRGLVWSSDEFLGNISWVTSTGYLRKPLTHVGVGESLASTLMPGLKRRAHQAAVDLKAVIKCLRWGDPFLGFRMVNKYVFSTFAWYCPLFFPSAAIMHTMSALQVSIMVNVLHLFIPHQASEYVAWYLNRARRRYVLIMLSHLPALDWRYLWQLRTWNYIGHVLRMDSSSTVFQALRAWDGAQRPRGGVVTTPMRWARSMASRWFDLAPQSSLEELRGLAAQRESWLEKGKSGLLAFHAAEYVHPIVRPCDLPRWHQFVQRHTPWLLSVGLTYVHGIWTFLWVDAEHGVQQYELPDWSSPAALTMVRYLHMQYGFCMLEVGMAHDDYDVLCNSFHSLAQQVYDSFQLMLTSQIVSEDWILRFRGLLDA